MHYITMCELSHDVFIFLSGPAKAIVAGQVDMPM